jgi:hypothetical protein
MRCRYRIPRRWSISWATSRATPRSNTVICGCRYPDHQRVSAIRAVGACAPTVPVSPGRRPVPASRFTAVRPVRPGLTSTPRAFRVSGPLPATTSTPVCVKTLCQDKGSKIAGCVLVTVEHQPAALAPVGPLRQGQLGFHVPTARAGLRRRVEGVGLDERPARPGRLVTELAAQLPPARVGDAAGEAVVRSIPAMFRCSTTTAP